MTAGAPGVSVVVPVRDGGALLAGALDAVLAQEYPGRIEVIAIDDGSGPVTREVLARFASGGRVRLLAGAGGGVAAALNLGIAAAREDLVAQVDQDVVVAPSWLARLVEAVNRDGADGADGIAAAQGWVGTDARASLWARVMGRDLEERYARIRGREVDHVCTGNTLYRRGALLAVGGLDETMGYGADVDLSYRLRRAGFRLVFCREARSVHHWREGLRGYLRQQYGFGYGRLDVLARHPGRLRGDHVAGTRMMAHAPLALLATCALGAGLALRMGDRAAGMPLAIGGGTLALLLLERTVAGARAALRFRDPAALLFPVAHVLRDLVWIAAVAVWTARRALRRPSLPAHSMPTRKVEGAHARSWFRSPSKAASPGRPRRPF